MATSAEGHSHGKPVQIIEMKTGKLELHKQTLEETLLQPQLKDLPVIVLSIAGIFRSGKSYLLNLLVNHLSKDINRPSGFPWNSGTDRVTTGIWMWNQIFTATLPDGRKVGVILMDTQGTQDPKTSQKHNAAVFALSAILSSIQIYNVKDYIDEGDLQFLELFVRYGIAIKGDNENPFQRHKREIQVWEAN
ncbi:atlastin-2-like [Anneissia japonica]|uniref:atlastin-2-like n=1 Tax=Anneissia japonica TaxID=1529436 RepID=UPI001425875A|nr:atlastin-2-like [Anneissia japonica]